MGNISIAETGIRYVWECLRGILGTGDSVSDLFCAGNDMDSSGQETERGESILVLHGLSGSDGV